MADDPVADLAALNIDSPDMRWLAVRDYLDDLQATALKKLNAVWLAAEFMDLVEANALMRLGGPNALVKARNMAMMLGAFYGSDLTPAIMDYGLCKALEVSSLSYAPIDYLQARSVILRRYHGKARERARAIIERHSPLPISKSHASA